VADPIPTPVTDTQTSSAPQAGRLLTIYQVAARLQVSRRTVYHWIQKGRLQVTRTPGGAPRIAEEALTLVRAGAGAGGGSALPPAEEPQP
jgi:excisionase family DNA binding protein